MKSIITTLLVIMGYSGTAQSVKYAEPDVALIESQPIQLVQMGVPALDVASDSPSTVFAANAIPDAPIAIPVTAIIRAIPSPAQKDFRTFRSDRYNRLLVANEFWARGLDAWSTYKKLNDPCRCFHEGSHLFGLDLTPAFENPAGVYAYSFGVATAYSFISAKLWDASKEHPRHERLLRTLSRGLLIGDSAMEFTAAIRNLTITKPRSMNK